MLLTDKCRVLHNIQQQQQQQNNNKKKNNDKKTQKQITPDKQNKKQRQTYQKQYSLKVDKLTHANTSAADSLHYYAE